MLTVYPTDHGTYLVYIYDDLCPPAKMDVYEMSRDANMPNGVNMYLGTDNEFPMPKGLPCDEIPLGTVRAICKTVAHRTKMALLER